MSAIKDYVIGRTIAWAHAPAPLLAQAISVVLVLSDGNRIMVGRDGTLYDHDGNSLDTADLSRRTEPPK